MSSTTPNLGLTKTTAAETIGQNWAASNESGGNFDIIDTKMGAVGSQSVQAQLDALNSNKANFATESLELGIYDLDTFTGKTIQTTAYIIGGLKFIPFEINETLTIGTMLQLRGSFHTVFGGSYYNHVNGGEYKAIQPYIIGRIYFRPNITVNNANVHISGFIVATVTAMP